jgi:hypothetical protein
MMNDSTRVRRRPRRARPWPARTAAAIIATVGLALLAAACGGSPGSHVAQVGSTTTKSSTSSSAVAAQQNGMLAFSRCVRSHGVPKFPDPNSSGALPKRQVAQLTASNPQFPAAHRACEYLLPNGGQPTQAQVQQAWNDMRNFARCMRSHGVPDWPDPAATSQQDQRPFFHLPDSVDPNAPQITTKIRACQHVLHANSPLVTAQ